MYAVVTFDLLEADDAERDVFDRQIQSFGWRHYDVKTTTTLFKKFTDHHSAEECYERAEKTLLQSCEEAELTGEIRYCIVVTPLPPKVATQAFKKGKFA
jgi:hypothetical protein